MERVTERVDFEKKVIGSDGNTKRIDVYIPETHVLIEQKSLGIPLDKPQAGHGGMTPYGKRRDGLFRFTIYFQAGYMVRLTRVINMARTARKESVRLGVRVLKRPHKNEQGIKREPITIINFR